MKVAVANITEIRTPAHILFYSANRSTSRSEIPQAEIEGLTGNRVIVAGSFESNAKSTLPYFHEVIEPSYERHLIPVFPQEGIFPMKRIREQRFLVVGDTTRAFILRRATKSTFEVVKGYCSEKKDAEEPEGDNKPVPTSEPLSIQFGLFEVVAKPMERIKPPPFINDYLEVRDRIDQRLLSEDHPLRTQPKTKVILDGSTTAHILKKSTRERKPLPEVRYPTDTQGSSSEVFNHFTDKEHEIARILGTEPGFLLTNGSSLEIEPKFKATVIQWITSNRDSRISEKLANNGSLCT